MEQSAQENIKHFDNDFTTYYQTLLEYLNSILLNDGKYPIAHPELVQLANHLQVSFIKLPDVLQNRLLEMEFEVFLHCQNIVDFYSFREFLLNKNRFESIATIAERVDSEIKLASMIASEDIWDRYSRLPKRNFAFYRKGESKVDIMKELQHERELEKQKIDSGDKSDVDIQPLSLSEEEHLNTHQKDEGFFERAANNAENVDKQLQPFSNITTTVAQIWRNLFTFLS